MSYWLLPRPRSFAALIDDVPEFRALVDLGVDLDIFETVQALSPSQRIQRLDAQLRFYARTRAWRDHRRRRVLIRHFVRDRCDTGNDRMPPR